MNVFVTGGAGYIGSHTAVELINAGHEVIILDDLSNAKADVIDRMETITGTRPAFYCMNCKDTDALRSVFSAHKIDAVIRSILVPDKNGRMVDVVLGYDTPEEYLTDDCYLGATVGRVCNRIKGAQFELNGKSYSLCANNGPNHLHGGRRGFSAHVWNSEQVGDCVVFSRLSPDGEEGYPGSLSVRVTFGWEGSSLTIRYEAETDKDTILNLTNHSYFNLNGAGNGDINRHILKVNAQQYTLNGEDGVPTGEVVSVAGSAMDFRTPKPIGKDADRDEPCVSFFGGYDSNFVLSGRPIAAVTGEQTGITLEVDTDQPGVQLYTCNAMSPRKGKGGKAYGRRSAFCLETQRFPDSIHHPRWPSCILRTGETFRSVTTFTFR